MFKMIGPNLEKILYSCLFLH